MLHTEYPVAHGSFGGKVSKHKILLLQVDLDSKFSKKYLLSLSPIIHFMFVYLIDNDTVLGFCLSKGIPFGFDVIWGHMYGPSNLFPGPYWDGDDKVTIVL